MNRLALVIAVLCAVVVGSAMAFWLSRRPATEPAPRLAAPVAAPEPASETPATPPRAVTPSSAADAATPATPAVPELGTLRIDADVEGAMVFIDRRYLGTTPVVAENLSPGTHLLNVTAQGFDGIAETIDIEPGPREIIYRLRQIRLDADLAVVHKHRLGSCRGQLEATPDGLVFEPTEGDDRFRVSLADLELVEVDYQEGNLRIRIRGGRQYDFADPDGNADRLFVFQRDVEKARQQIARGDGP